MSMSQDQRDFGAALGAFLIWLYREGYEVTLGDAYATSGHSEHSFHYKRLAIDLNLFIDGVYQTSTEAHRPLGEQWKKMGGTWGGDFPRKDGNHYSWGEGK